VVVYLSQEGHLERVVGLRKVRKQVKTGDSKKYTEYIGKTQQYYSVTFHLGQTSRTGLKKDLSVYLIADVDPHCAHV
jgi:hypothetical protein